MQAFFSALEYSGRTCGTMTDSYRAEKRPPAAGKLLLSGESDAAEPDTYKSYFKADTTGAMH